VSRARATALALVNWKGVFYERYQLDRRVTALEGANGAGKTTVMIAAYIVLLPDMSRLRFTNLGETAAIGGDRGIWGRLGEPTRPSYAAIELDLDAGVRARLGAGIPVNVTQLLVRGTTDSTDASITIRGHSVALQGLSFSEVVSLAEGLNVIVITSEDTAGNHRRLELNVTRDTVEPALAIEEPDHLTLLVGANSLNVSGTTGSETAVVGFNYVDLRGIPATDLVQSVRVGSEQVFRFAVEFGLITDEASHRVEVRASDLAGNVASTNFTYRARVGAHFLEVAALPAEVTRPYVWLNGTTDAWIVGLKINGQDQGTPGHSFSVRWNLSLIDGNHTIVVEAFDNLGHTARAVRTTHLTLAALPDTISFDINGTSQTAAWAGEPTRFSLNGSWVDGLNVTWSVDG